MKELLNTDQGIILNHSLTQVRRGFIFSQSHNTNKSYTQPLMAAHLIQKTLHTLLNIKHKDHF